MSRRAVLLTRVLLLSLIAVAGSAFAAPKGLSDSDSVVNPKARLSPSRLARISFVIPPGSFKLLTNGAKAGSYTFAGKVGGVDLTIQIASVGVTRMSSRSLLQRRLARFTESG